MVDTAANFGGSIPEHYDSILGPAQFDAFAADLVRRIPVRPKGDVLELACGTGRLTAKLRERIDPFLRVVATDISDDMLAYARGKVKGKIDWRKADAAALPFKDGTFGAVVCGFGVMFVPDKHQLFSEARRVLVEGGLLAFNVWDRIERNVQAQANADVMEALFPGDPEMAFATIPFGYSNHDHIRGDVQGARFSDIRIEPVKIDIRAPSARAYAIGQVRGTPRALLIEKKGGSLDEVVARVTEKLAEIGGAEPFHVEGHALAVQAKAV